MAHRDRAELLRGGGSPAASGSASSINHWLVIAGLLAQILILPVMAARLRAEQRQATRRIEQQVAEMRARLASIEQAIPVACACPLPQKSWGHRHGGAK